MIRPSELDRRLDLFAHLSHEARAEFETASRLRAYDAGERIYTEERLDLALYRLVSGKVWLSCTCPDGRELLLGLLYPGECFGFSPMIDGEGLPHRAVAQGPVSLQVIDQPAFQRLRRHHPSIDEALSRSLMRDVRILTLRVLETSLGTLRERLAHRLLTFASPGREELAEVPLSQAELAGTLGVSRQSLNKCLRQLETDGLVSLGYRTVVLTDLPALTELAHLPWASDSLGHDFTELRGEADHPRLAPAVQRA